MPFTPLHIIPGIIIYLLFFPYVDLLALTAATILMDAEPFVNLFILNARPLHGVFHTLFGALLVAAPMLTLGCRVLETRSRTLVKAFRVVRWNPTPRQIPLKTTILSVYIGIISHLLLDYWAREALPTPYQAGLNNPSQFEAFDLWSFDLASYLLLWPHLLLYMSGLVLTPVAYVIGRHLHEEKPFSYFP